MNITNLVPWSIGKRFTPTRKDGNREPALLRQRPMERLFDEFIEDFSITPFTAMSENYMPRIDVAELDKEIRVTAELPGLDEKDVNISMTRDMLVIEGEKKAEREERGVNTYRLERQWGSFRRAIPIQADVDGDKVNATFKKGVLTVTLPKTKGARSDTRHIKVHAD